jgi:carbon-monoxide dehydrogenase medium subunit
VKPPPLDILTPTTIEDAVSLLSDYGMEARPLAGGQSLVPLLNFRLSRPEVLIDLNKIPELDYINEVGDQIEIGAMTRERSIEFSELIRDCAPLLWEATKNIAHLPIRSRGTIGGSLANADPAAEYPAAALALEMVFLVQSIRGERLIKSSDFFQDVLTTSLEPDELLTKIIIPKIPENSGAAFEEIARRHGDFAIAGVAAQITFRDKIPTAVNLAACGAGPVAMRLFASETIILKEGIGRDAIKAAAAAAAASVDPMSDHNASASYRRRLTRVVTARAIDKALHNAGVVDV